METVGDLCVCALVIVTCHHATHFLRGAVRPLLGQRDVEQLVGELGPVVVLVQDPDDHCGGGAQRWRPVV